MFSSILKDLITNLALFTSSIFILGQIFKKEKIFGPYNQISFKNKILIGLIHGGIGTIIMFYGFNLFSGTILDLRHLSIIVSASFGGLPAALVTGAIIGFDRIFLMNGPNLPAFIGALNAINMAIGCGLITQMASKKRAWIYMNMYCLISLTIVITYLIRDIELFLSVILSVYIVSIISGYCVIKLLRYVIRTNGLYIKVKKSEENYRIIAENMSDIVTVLDTEGTVLYASPSHETILGVNLDSFVGTRPEQYIHPDDLKRINRIFYELTQNKQEFQTMCRWKYKNEEWLHFDLKGMPIIDEKGEVEKVVFVSRDITERVVAEEQLRLTLRDLRDLEYALDESSIVSITDEKGVINYVNDNFCASSGFEREELIGRSHRIISSGYHPKKFFKELWETIITGRVWKGEIRNNSKSGDSRWFETTIVPFMRGGKPYQYISIRTDVTERKKEEIQMKKLSYTDGLTHLYNRRFLDEEINKEWEIARQSEETISLMIIDIDHFKAFNDTYGHLGGDACLKTVANKVNEIAKSKGYSAARYGGEEFTIILPKTNQESAFILAERIREGVENLAIPHKTSKTGSVVTVSIGVASTTPDCKNKATDLIEKADKALYFGKNRGRNQVHQYVKGM